MSKRKQHHGTGQRAQPPSGPGPEAWRIRIESLLAHGKSRDAVEAAKQYLRHAPGPEAEALAVKAYAARIEALQASGLHREAQAIGALVRERFPAHQSEVAVLMCQSEVAAGNFDALLAELVTADASRRRALEVILARGLSDPAVLAESPVLPADHPLKRMARAVSDALTAVTTGPVPAGALATLDEIPRHSLLAPWKLLIRALDAFYRRADAAVLANLAGIPPDSGPARLVPVLRRLVGENGLPAELSPAATTLIEHVSGQRTVARTQLSQLSQALAAHDERRALAAVQALLPLFRAAPTALQRMFLVSVLHHWHRQGLSPDRLLRLLPSSKHDPDMLRLLALTLERSEWDTALAMWDGYLTAATATGRLPTTGPEIARVLLHMANLFPADPEAVLDTLEVDSEQQLRRRMRTGQLPACFDRAALLERARVADPVPQVYRALVAHYDQWGDPKRAEAEAEAWRRAHPQDLEPLLYLIRATERRGAIRKALALLADAEALDRVHPEVRQSRFRLLLAGAERRIKEGRPALALDDLERLTHEPRASEGDYPAYLLALRWIAAQQRGDTAATAQLDQTLTTTVANPVLHGLILEALGASLKVQLPPRPAAASTPGQVIDGLARACDLFRALDRPLTVPAAVLKRAEQSLAHASAAQLHALCAGGLWMGRPALTYHAAGRGLALSDPLAYRFLLARGQALCACPAFDVQERARMCLRAARELAGRARDMEAVREASTALDNLPNWGMLDAMLTGVLSPPTETALTQEEIAHVIERERRNRTTPRFPVTSTPRKRRRSKPRRHRLPRGLLEDIFAFFPFED
jgi:tetratricopeptide (TPR) repeat protein